MEATPTCGAKAPEMTPPQARRREAESIAANLRKNPLLKDDVMDILDYQEEHNGRLRDH